MVARPSVAPRTISTVYRSDQGYEGEKACQVFIYALYLDGRFSQKHLARSLSERPQAADLSMAWTRRGGCGTASESTGITAQVAAFDFSEYRPFVLHYANYVPNRGGVAYFSSAPN